MLYGYNQGELELLANTRCVGVLKVVNGNYDICEVRFLLSLEMG